MTPYELAALVAAATPIARPFAQRAAQLFFRLLHPATDRGAEEIAGYLFPEAPSGTDVPSLVVHWRARNTAVVLVRAAEILEGDEIEVREVPRSWVLPLLESAGNVENADLQGMWARLLASGVAADEHQHPMWVKILAQMSAEDAKAFADAVSATDREDAPFVLEPARPGWTMVPPEPVDARLHALGLVELVERHDESTPPEQRAGTGTLPCPVARLSALGAQFRDAVMPSRAAD